MRGIDRKLWRGGGHDGEIRRGGEPVPERHHGARHQDRADQP